LESEGGGKASKTVGDLVTDLNLSIQISSILLIKERLW